MTVKSSMESYAARLASFNATHPATKKRASDPKGKRTLKWPHKSPSPPQLARAGFFYRPSSSSPDNTTCYLCQSSLDGWEEDDDAVVEHLKHAPECGWAVTVAIEQDVENGSYSLENPMSERVLNARRMTFGTNWPHENKKGWMAEAGWHYCPTPESEDFVKCSYCQLSLDGWEPKDKPFDEHQRRSPDCSFFTLYASIEAKPGRAKKNRASKSSRMSTQSNFTAVSEGVSITETEANPDETMISTAESTRLTKSARGGKKASQARRPASKAKRKASRAKEEEPQVVSSFLEPEDDDFEVKVAPSPAATVSNNKRKSENISTTKASRGHLRTEENEVEAEQPSAKRRNTRARVSVAQAQETSINAPLGEDVLDTHMSDVEEMPPPSAPVSKKKGKGGRKRASSNTRKASNTSTASKASLRAAVPNDEEIEAALEADLDRPLTDDETGAEHAEIERPKGRRLTRTKPGSKKATASIAPTRRGTRASSVIVHEPPMTDIYPVIRAAAGEDSKAVLQKDSESLENYEIAKPSPKAKITKAKPSRKASAQQQSHDDCTKGNAESSDESVAVIHEMQPQLDAFVSKSQKLSTRRVSQQLPTRNTRASNVPDLRKFVDPVADVNNSMLATQTVHDDSGHETDAGGLKQSRTKRPNKKPSDAVKKSKRGKKAALASRNVEDVAHAPVNEIQPEETNEAPTVASDQTNIAETVATDSTLPEEVVVKVTKPTKPSKTKGKSAKAKAAAQKAPVPPSPEQSPTVMEIQDAPASPPPPPVHMTPPPALSPQSSDAENQPPSSRPSTLRPPLLMQSPSKSQMTRIPLAASTPISSPSKGNFSKLQSSLPWTAVDLGQLFNGSPNADKENDPFALGKATGSAQDELTSPETKLTVEQWIQFNAQRGEESLRSECERLVGKFENEGVRALRTLEGIVCFN